jgi:uncharacterized protein YqhQ
MKPSGIGGMAVIEGVMMKNKDEYAIAVRKPNNEIAVEKKTHKDFAEKVKLFKLPIFRGMLAFVDSMVVGVKALNFASSFFEEEEQAKPDKKNKSTKADQKNSKDAKAGQKNNKTIAEGKKGKKSDKAPVAEVPAAEGEKEEKSNTLLMAAAVVVSLMISITFFMILPVLVSNLFSKVIDSRFWLSLLEGVLRIIIFVGYILAVSQMPDIKRVFMYHGAEHKTINCLENGFELTVENVKWQSKQHKRCGTSFMLLVMLISVIFFILIQPSTLLWRVVSRILLVPIIAGASYEFIRLAGRSNNKIINILSQPGMWMQALTTKEPDDSMIEVAIQSVDAVFDWRAFLETSQTEDKKSNKVHSIHESKAKDLGNKENQPATRTEKNTRLDKTGHINTTAIKEASLKKSEDEDDDILKALDKYLDCEEKEISQKTGN